MLKDLRCIFGITMIGPSQQQDRYFRFLRRLRAEGRTNMYGGVPYLMRSFAIDRDRAFAVVCEWLDRQRETESLEALPAKPPRRKSARRKAA
jgi:hypothetical protein